MSNHPTEIFFKDRVTRKSYSLKLGAGSDAPRTISQLQTRLLQMMSQEAPHGKRCAKINLVYEGKVLPEHANCTILKPLSSVTIEYAGALPGGALLSSSDDDYQRATAINDDDPLSFANSAARKSFVSQTLKEEDVANIEAGMDIEDLLNCHLAQLETRLDEELKGEDQDIVDYFLSELNQWNDAVAALEDGRKRIIARVLTKTLHETGLGRQWEDKDQLWLKYINVNPQERFLYRLRSRTFNMKQVLMVMNIDIQMAIDQYMLLQSEDQLQWAFAEEDTTHPQGLVETEIQHNYSGHLSHLPANERDTKSYMRSELGEAPENDMSLISNQFYLKVILDMILAMTPKVYRETFLAKEAPNEIRFLLELVESARNEALFDLLLQATKKFDDEFHHLRMRNKHEDFIGCLTEKFKSYSVNEQIELVNATSNMTLQSILLRQMSPEQIKRMLDKKKQSPKQSIELLNKCSEELRQKVLALYSEDDKAKFQAYQILYLTGYPHKSIDTMIKEAKTDYDVINSATYKFIQALPWPGMSNKFIILGKQLTAEVFEKGAKDSDKDNKEDEADKEVAKEDSEETQTRNKNINIDVKTFKLFDKDKLTQRLAEPDIRLEEAQKTTFVKDQCPDINYHNQMRNDIGREEPSTSYSISFWEIQDNEAFVMVDFQQIQEPANWKVMAKYLEDDIKHQYMFRGHEGEVFWFEKKTGEEEQLVFKLIKQDSEKPEEALINKESKLHRLMLEGSQDRQVYNDDNKYRCLPVAVPTVFKDTPDTPVIAYSDFTWEKGRTEVFFYDLNLGRDIGRAFSANWFCGYLPSEGKVVFQRDLIMCALQEVHNLEEMESVTTGHAMAAMFNMKGYPTLYVTDVDFSAMRESEEVTEIIADDFAECAELKNQYSQLTQEEAVARNDSEDNEHWITCLNDDPIFNTYQAQAGAVIATPIRTNKLLSWHLQVFDPDGDTNIDTYYELSSLKHGSKFFYNEPHHCYTVYNEKEDQTLVMMNNPVSGALMYADLLKDPKKTLYTSDWPRRFSKASCYQPMTIHDGHICRLTISGHGELSASIAKLPDKPTDPSLQFKNFDFDDTKNPILVDYPLMSTIRGKSSISIDNLSSSENSKKIFNFGEVEIICFLEGNQASSDGRVNLLALDNESGRVCIIALRHERPFEHNEPKDLSNWFAEKFILHESFNQLLEDANHISQAFLLDVERELSIRQKDLQPAVMIVTRNKVALAMKGTYEILLKSTSKVKLLPIPIIRGQNDTFYCVMQETMSRTSQIVEIKLSEVNNKYTALKRNVLAMPSTTPICFQLDPKSLKQSDFAWTLENKKVIREGQLAQLFLLDETMNLRKVEQRAEGDYEQLWMRNLAHIPRLQDIVEDLPAGHEMILSDRTITVNGECFVFSTEKSFDIFYDEMGDWKVVENQRARGTDKVIAKMRHEKTGQFRYVIKSDLATRSIDLFGLKIRRDVRKICWISQTKLLVELVRERRIQVEVEGEEDKKIILNTYWTIIDVNGKTYDVPAPLRDILQKTSRDESWTDALQGVHLNGQRELILSNSTTVGSVKFAEDGNVCSHVYFDFSQHGEFGEDDRNFLTEKTLSDFEGNIYRISICKAGEQTGIPKFKRRVVKEGTQLIFFEFEEGQVGTDYTVCGDYLCWRAPDSRQVQVCYMQTIEDHKNVADVANLQKFIKTLDFSRHHKDKAPHTISLNTLNAMHALHAYPSREIDLNSIRESRNQLQVTFGNRSVIYKLDDGDDPTSSPELNAVDKFLDPQRYTENGIQVTYNSVQKGLKTNAEFGLCRYIQSRPQGEYYGLMQRAIVPAKVRDDKKTKEDEKLCSFLGFYRSYSEQALQEVNRLRQVQKDGLTPKTVDTQILLANFDGSTIFSIFSGWNKLWDLLYETVQFMQLQPEEDLDETDVENTLLRSINRVLQQKVGIVYEEVKDEVSKATRHVLKVNTVVMATLEMPSERDLYLKIGRLSKEFSIFDDIWDQETFSKLVERTTPQLTEELDNCFRESKSTSLTTHFAWPTDLDMKTYCSKNFVFDPQELMDHLKAENEEEDKLLPRPVKVRMFKLAWMQREGKNFIVLTPSLGENSDDFYKSQFMNGMLTHFWPDIQEKIFWRQFLPFVMYMLTSVLFMYYALRPNPESLDPMAIGPFEIGMAVLTLLCLLYAVRNEFLQFSRMEDKLSYFTSFWNYVDLVGIAFTLVIIISAFSGENGLISYEVLRILAAFASCCQMIKCYDWLRLFESTSFYILLITETLNDIKPFMILLAVTLLTFGIPMVLLNLNRSDDNAIIDPVFGFWLLDLVMNQYLLALGEFNMDAFSDNPQSALCYIFFILATFITQLTMLNMLIAIMGDTFGRVMENAEVNGTKTKLDLMSDLASIIGTNTNVASNEGDYLFMVTPDDDEGDHGDSWEGAINKMNNMNEKRHEELQELVKSQAGKLVDLAQADIKREVTQNAELRRVIYDMIQHTVAQSESNIRSEIDELKEMIRSIKN